MFMNCVFCECKLWSNYSKSKGQCPDCEAPDAEQPESLEESLENIFKKDEKDVKLYDVPGR